MSAEIDTKLSILLVGTYSAISAFLTFLFLAILSLKEFIYTVTIGSGINRFDVGAWIKLTALQCAHVYPLVVFWLLIEIRRYLTDTKKFTKLGMALITLLIGLIYIGFAEWSVWGLSEWSKKEQIIYNAFSTLGWCFSITSIFSLLPLRWVLPVNVGTLTIALGSFWWLEEIFHFRQYLGVGLLAALSILSLIIILRGVLGTKGKKQGWALLGLLLLTFYFFPGPRWMINSTLSSQEMLRVHIPIGLLLGLSWLGLLVLKFGYVQRFGDPIADMADQTRHDNLALFKEELYFLIKPVVLYFLLLVIMNVSVLQVFTFLGRRIG